MDTPMQTHVLGGTHYKLKLPAVITIPNCSVILYPCLKSYKWRKWSEEETELLVPMRSSSLRILILFCYSPILALCSVVHSQTTMGSTVPSDHFCPIHVTAKKLL